MFKFRGVSLKTGELVYGDLIHKGLNVLIQVGEGDDKLVPVDFLSVKQLVGLDEEGVEVYDGDEVQDNLGNTYTAEVFRLIMPLNTIAHADGLLFLPAYNHITLKTIPQKEDIQTLMKKRFYKLAYEVDNGDCMFVADKWYCIVHSDKSFQFSIRCPKTFQTYKSEIGSNVYDSVEFDEIYLRFTKAVVKLIQE